MHLNKKRLTLFYNASGSESHVEYVWIAMAFVSADRIAYTFSICTQSFNPFEQHKNNDFKMVDICLWDGKEV